MVPTPCDTVNYKGYKKNNILEEKSDEFGSSIFEILQDH